MRTMIHSSEANSITLSGRTELAEQICVSRYFKKSAFKD